MSNPTPDYVKRALDRKIDEARKKSADAILAIHHRNNAAGRLESGATLIESNESVLALANAEMKNGAELVFNAFEQVTDEGIRLLTNYGDALAQAIAVPVMDWARAGKDGPIGPIKSRMADELQQRLALMVRSKLDDFSHGMHEGARLMKEPVVNNIINNTMTNSPGAVQQAGVGTFSQSAFAQQTVNLTKAIDTFLASREFQALTVEQKNAVGDVADALRQEATQEKPDPGKLRRWAERLSGLTKEFGLHVAASGVWHAIAAVFPGSPAL